MNTWADFSDNNALPLDLRGLGGAMLKLYLPGTRGGLWLAQAHAQVVEAGLDVGFYAPGDVTPAYGQQKNAAAAIGVDLHDHPWALDLEFGYTPADILTVMHDARADGMTCRGLYQRTYRNLDQTWDWPSIGAWHDGNVPTFRNPRLVQFDTTPYDQDAPYPRDTTLDEFRAATISSWKEPPPVTQPEWNAMFEAATGYTVDNAAYWLRMATGIGDVARGHAKRTIPEPYGTGFDWATGVAAGNGGTLPPELLRFVDAFDVAP